MQQILVPTDFSERSNRAIRRAALLASELHARVLLLHVVDDDRPQRLVAWETDSAQELLDATIASALRDLRCEARVALGDPFDQIAKIAASSAADLIVMGSHRKQLLRDVFVGTSIERVARLRVAPVLMVNTEPTGPYRHSLVATDLSEHSGHALQTAFALGMLSSSQVVVVHAFAVPAKGKMNYAGVEPDVISRHVAQSAQNAKSDVTGFLDRLGIDIGRYAIRVKEGPPVAVITEVANTEQADIVVTGAQGHSGVLKLLLGSVSEELMRSLDRDILVVPHRPLDAATT